MSKAKRKSDTKRLDDYLSQNGWMGLTSKQRRRLLQKSTNRKLLLNSIYGKVYYG